MRFFFRSFLRSVYIYIYICICINFFSEKVTSKVIEGGEFESDVGFNITHY